MRNKTRQKNKKKNEKERNEGGKCRDIRNINKLQYSRENHTISLKIVKIDSHPKCFKF